MISRGLRGRSSPLKSDRTTDAQKATIDRLRKEADESGEVGVWELRYSTYIGPGCAAEHGDLTIVHDGRIAHLVMPDGGSY